MNETFGLKKSDLQNIISILQNEDSIEKAIIFGSRAKENYKEGSDVDIALYGKKIDRSIISRISFILNEETLMPYKFDVVNYKSINNKDLIAHIDRIGKLIYSKSS